MFVCCLLDASRLVGPSIRCSILGCMLVQVAYEPAQTVASILYIFLLLLVCFSA